MNELTVTVLPPVTQSVIQSSPQGSPGLTDGGSSTPARNSPSPATPSKSTPKTDDAPTSANPAKRKKLTAEEREARDKEATEKREAKERETAEKKKEREEKAAQKASEKAKLEEEKAVRAQEREEKRKQKEEEEKKKTEEREEKKKQKEADLQRIQEEKDKKARAQPKLMSFFGAPKTPKKTTDAATEKTASPLKNEPLVSDTASKSTYDKMFQPFYIRENVTVASLGPKMDTETRAAKSTIVDECIRGERGDMVCSFNPMEVFTLLRKPRARGKLHQPVKGIMEASVASSDASGDALHTARRQLRGLPLKIIAFSQDVRPPYYGTATQRPAAVGQPAMSRQGRHSTSRLLPLEYDYDSEAEWQEEEGEDLDADDDEEELDDEDDMDGFLDDSEDSGLSRHIFANAMEPDSTGLCFEGASLKTLGVLMQGHKMEMIHNLSSTGSIDPFSTSYWEPEPKPATAVTTTKTDKMPPPPAPANAFAAISSSAPATGSNVVKLVKDELLNDFKQAILDHKTLSKVGIIEFISNQFRDSASRVEVKNTLELVAEKKGKGRSKEWDLRPGHEIAL